MAKTKGKTNDTGLEIVMGSGKVEEVDIAGGGEVIDPQKVAEAVSAQAADDALDISIGEEEVIIDENKEEGTDDKSKVKDTLEDDDDPDAGKSLDKEGIKTDHPDDQALEGDNTGDPETFKILGEHFYNQGILEGYDAEMENTEEAFQSMVQKTIDKGIEDYKNTLSNPVSKQFLDFVENGGDPGQFYSLVSGPDYSKVTPESLEENEAVQKQILRAYYEAQGETPEEIEETIQAFEDAGSLGKKSNTALGRLQKSQTESRNEAITRQKIAKAEEKQQIDDYLDNLQTNINSKEEIAGFKMTKKTQSDLFDYITKVDPKTGQTKLLSDSQDPDKQLMMAFLHFNNFNFTKLEKKTKSAATTDLMSKLGRHTDTSQKQKSRKQTPVQKTEHGNSALGS